MTYVMVLVSVLLSVVLVLGAFLAGMTIANDYHRQMRNHAADILGYRRQIEQAVLPQQEPSVIPEELRAPPRIKDYVDPILTTQPSPLASYGTPHSYSASP